MKKIIEIILMLVGLSFLVSMIYLWKWNVNGTGVWFAVAMIVLSGAFFGGSVLHFYKTYFKK